MIGTFGDLRDLTQAPGWMSWSFIKMERSGMREGLGRKLRSSSLNLLVWRYLEPWGEGGENFVDTGRCGCGTQGAGSGFHFCVLGFPSTEMGEIDGGLANSHLLILPPKTLVHGVRALK